MNAAMGSRIAMLAAAVVALSTVAFIFAAKPKTPDQIHRSNIAAADRINKDIDNAAASLAAHQAEVEKQTWKGLPQVVGPAALDTVTKIARGCNLKLVAFRPQRSTDADGLTQIPYLITLDGSYPQVMAFMRSVEKPETKLATNLFSVSSTDGASDRVTATIGVVAYISSSGGGTQNKNL